MAGFTLSESADRIPFRPTFFAKSPFRSYFFVCDTLLLAVVLSVQGFILAHYWSRLTAVGAFWLALAGVCMVGIWLLALRCYRMIHELIANGGAGLVSDDSLPGVAMSVAGAMIHGGLFLGCMMMLGALIGMSSCLR